MLSDDCLVLAIALHGSGSDLLGERKAEVLVGIDGCIEDADLVVEMGAGTASALTHIAQGIAAVNHLSQAHGKTGKMPVESTDAVAVIDNDRAAVAVHQVGKLNHAIRGRNDLGADLAGNIHTAMKRAFPTEGINPFAKRSGDPSRDRP